MSLIYKGQTIADVGGAGGGGGVPKGTIVIWSGAATAIPSGWALCDGQNGTPDLRDRFVVGASGEYAVGDTGGEATHALTVDELPSHSHNFYTWRDGAGGSGPEYPNQNTNGSVRNDVPTGSTGSSQPHNNLPPYYALCYIMKITDSGSGSNSGGSSEDVYSTEETRIGTWIDGKPLYRKVAHLSLLDSTTNQIFDIGLADVDTVAGVKTVSKRSAIANGWVQTGFIVSNDFYFVCGLRTDNFKLWVSTKGMADFAGQPAFAIIEYTKTTD